MTKVQIDVGVIEKAAIAAFQDSCQILGRRYTELISAPGAFAGFPGDIVDTGALRASQRLDFVSPTYARFGWTVEYALYVHEGYQRRNGTGVRGRPWGRVGLEQFNLQETTSLLLRQRL